jgi:hypothetical protein
MRPRDRAKVFENFESEQIISVGADPKSPRLLKWQAYGSLAADELNCNPSAVVQHPSERLT